MPENFLAAETIVFDGNQAGKDKDEHILLRKNHAVNPEQRRKEQNHPNPKQAASNRNKGKKTVQ